MKQEQTRHTDSEAWKSPTFLFFYVISLKISRKRQRIRHIFQIRLHEHVYRWPHAILGPLVSTSETGTNDSPLM